MMDSDFSTSELKGGMSINDSMYTKQTKNLKLKMKVNLSRAQEN